jgi:hypothetical protein
MDDTGTEERSPPLVPPYVDRDDERSMREWKLRRARRALGFARQMLHEASEDVVEGGAHERVHYSLQRAGVNADRAFDRLHKELRRLRTMRVYQWVSWTRGGEDQKVRHGEARTLADAKEGALRDLQQVLGFRFYDQYSLLDGVALVTGPSGARYELRRPFGGKLTGKLSGFRWHARGRDVNPRRAFVVPRAVPASAGNDVSATDAEPTNRTAQ